ncbi:putative 4-hydroxy-2-oxovalerate aldolase [Cadophora sp. DSE1049]|nr:putative 4-hydroxy-2-oxovalerate aldolase [Cadophora sp. DSE1049]
MKHIASHKINTFGMSEALTHGILSHLSHRPSAKSARNPSLEAEQEISAIMGSNTPQPAPPTFTVSNPFRDRILAGQVCSVISCKYATGNEIAMMCKMAGIDGMFIDMEHSSLNFNTVAQLSLACNFVGVSPIVRSPSKSHWHLSTILDAGAAAIVIPHIESLDEVRDIVKFAKYAPLGVRGCAGNQPMLNFQNVATLEQNDLLNRETMLIPMIETPRAVDLVDEIMAVPGVDGILIESNDLCTDLDIPGQYDNPLYQNAVTKIVLAGRKAGKPVGIGGIGGRQDLLEKWFAMGDTWSLSGADGSMIQVGMQKIGKEYRAMNGRVQKARGGSTLY